MGQHVSNSGLRGHGRGLAPVAVDLELWLHWGDHGIDVAAKVSKPEAEALIAASQVDQATFDVIAGTLAPWYALAQLTQAQRVKARAACRAGCAIFAGLTT